MPSFHARAKINWALNITGRRADGYHLLDMLMQGIDLCDEIAFEPAAALSLSVNGAAPAEPQANLVVRAANALNACAGTNFGARIELTKHIPEGGGPGGGLSTAAVFRLWDGGGWPEVELDNRALAEALCRGDLKAVDRLCANALTAPAISLMPEIGGMIQRMRAFGAGAAFMTGSGSTVVGAFHTFEAARAAAGAIPGAVLTRTLGNGNLA